jgi:hypothetical protein
MAGKYLRQLKVGLLADLHQHDVQILRPLRIQHRLHRNTHTTNKHRVSSA